MSIDHYLYVLRPDQSENNGITIVYAKYIKDVKNIQIYFDIFCYNHLILTRVFKAIYTVMYKLMRRNLPE